MPQALAYVVDNLEKANSLNTDSSFFVINIQTLSLADAGLRATDKHHLDQSYLDCLSQLAKDNRDLFWWANNVSEKNELLSSFYTRLIKLYLCSILLRQVNYPSKVIVICEDVRLSFALCSLFSSHYQVYAKELRWRQLSLHFRNALRYLLKFLLNINQAAFRSIYARLLLGKQLSEKTNNFSGVVIKAWIDQRSYNAHGKYQDAYYGDLIDHLRSQGNCILWGDVIRDFRHHVANIRRDQSYTIIPTEYYLSVTDILKAFVDSCRFHKKIAGPVLFEGIDISVLINDEISEGFFSLKFFDNILYYYKAKALASHLDIKRYIYTFENYALEKMCIAALRERNSGIDIVGFQHAFIARNSFKYFLGEGEIELVPKPDRIITMGQVTRRILASKGWKDALLTTGCALRQAKTLSQSPVVYGVHRTILVVFPMMFQESVEILRFLYDANFKDYPYSVILRFHPQTQVDKVLLALPCLPKNFVISKNSLAEDLQDTGIVLYTVSTVAIEALMVGLPVIYLNLNPLLNLDPLFEWEQLKAVVSVPKELQPAIERLTNLDKTDYQKQYESSKMYIKDYFYPVTKSCLNIFSQ